MDKRQEKTLHAIYDAFSRLINNKDYDEITIQDILNESRIGRSTFYCHFKDKNELLLSISRHIFEHVFSHSLKEEETHDFSKEDIFDYQHLITHIYYHIHDERELIKGILSSNGNQVFLDEFKTHLYSLVNSYYKNYPYKNENIPLDLVKDILVDNFISVIKYWMNNGFKESPVLISQYYIDIFKSYL